MCMYMHRQHVADYHQTIPTTRTTAGGPFHQCAQFEFVSFLQINHSRCPLCRAKNDVDPMSHPIDVEVEMLLLKRQPEEYASQKKRNQQRLRQLAENARDVPVFYMHPGSHVGDLVVLHLFEPRCAMSTAYSASISHCATIVTAVI
jgi:hypothetical protein